MAGDVNSSGGSQFVDNSKTSSKNDASLVLGKTGLTTQGEVKHQSHVEEFNKAHMTSDVNADMSAIHHTLGLDGLAALPALILDNIAPIGQRIDFAGTSDKLPAGFLVEDGRSLLVADYPLLFAKIGYSYGGAGDYFNIPDSRLRSTVGTNTDADLAGNDGQAVGSRNNDVNISVTIPSHSHSFTPSGGLSSDGSHVHSASASSDSVTDHAHTFGTGGPSSTINTLTSGGGTGAAGQGHSHSGTTSLAGGHSHAIYVNTNAAGTHSHTFTGSGGSTSSGGGGSSTDTDKIPYLKSTKAIRYSWGI